jgi:hypothetical protein
MFGCSFFFHCLELKKVSGILATARDLEIAMCVFNAVMTSVHNTAEHSISARSKCVTLLENWVCIASPPKNDRLPPPFVDEMDRWLLSVARCIVGFYHSWKDIKGFKNEQDLATAIKGIAVIEYISRIDISADSWKSLFRCMLDISHYYLGVTEEQRRGDVLHPPDKVLSCIITDGVFALTLRRVTPPEFWEELRHRERSTASIFNFHTTVDSWTRVLLVIARRLVMHLSPSLTFGRLPVFLEDLDYISWRIGGRGTQKSLSQASPWQHRVDPDFNVTMSHIENQLQPFFSTGSPWFPTRT